MKQAVLSGTVAVITLAFSQTLISQTATSSIPVVAIVATDASASGAGPARGAFTVHRSGQTNSALLVFYRISGTASTGVDYQQFSNTVTLPPGAATASIAIVPIDDNLAEGPETVILRLVA